ncbi:TIGR02117 family protein [Cytophagaceae bacterium ABcell3]|nr:TIGR02117 family protein [Cytophagaceae bacterium ABcell3]
MLYSVLLFLLGVIPVNRDFEPLESGDVLVYVASRGSHTYFVVPVKTDMINWTEPFPTEEFAAVDTTFQYISFGWGERRYYTQAADWSELNLRLALPAALLPTASAMHVEYYPDISSQRLNLIPLYLHYDDYKTLTEYIYRSFQQDEHGEVMIIPDAAREYNDNFYEATDYYHMFRTSNNWTSNGLKKLNVRTPVWSPLDEPVMRELRNAYD